MRIAMLLVALLVAQDPPPAKPIRVLYVDHLPRFEYRFLQKALLADESLAVHVFLCSADVDWEQPATRGVAPLKRADAESILTDAAKLARYDLVIWGDLQPAHVSADAPTYRKIPGALQAYVAGGGAVLFHAGSGYLQEAHPGAELAPLLPFRVKPVDPPPQDKEVEDLVGQLGSEDFAVREAATAKLFEIGERAVHALRRAKEGGDLEVRDRAAALLRSIEYAPGVAKPALVRLTEAGRSHRATRLEDSKLWTKSPRIRWAVRRAVPVEGARVLAELETGDPILVAHARDRGRVAALLTDEWWLWRQEGGYYQTYRAVLEWLARGD